jgi:biopolymer transport protein ExbD
MIEVPSDGKEDQIDMSPMIDMVFLLLIFFITQSKEYQDARLPVDLPIAQHAKVPKEPRDRQAISIEADGDIFLGSMTDTPVPLEQVKPTIEEALKTMPNMKIFLRADAATPHRYVRDVMGACAAGGVADVIFATYEEDK